ncbi:efflux RND transporter permease subunit [Clostridium sp. Marseille-Q7071]
MKKISRAIAKNRVLILILSVLLIFPSLYGFISTRVNYDLLTYLPEELDTMKAQKILNEKFDSGSMSMLIIENMETKDIVDLKEKVSKIEGVQKVLWVNDILDTSVPKEILPESFSKVFYSDDSTMLIIKFEDGSSSESTQNGIGEIRKITNDKCFLSGMAGIVKDTKELADKETPFFVLIATALSAIVLALTMNSYIIPIIFLTSIGMAVLYNFGTNIFFGEISYVTKALAAVLQLGVTMDYSIFLLHRYDEERGYTEDKVEAMSEAIANTMGSVAGSSLTTIAGFLALCVMELGLGKDIGLVMAKGVFIGLICTVTILPALILTFDNAIHKFNHKTILPEFEKTASLVTRKYKLFLAIFIIAFIPAIYGKVNAEVYYNLDESLPKDLPSIVATNKLKNDYNMTTTNMIIVKDTVSNNDINKMVKEIENIDGIEVALALEKFIGPTLPENFLPDTIKDTFQKEGYKQIIVNSSYKAATEEANKQIEEINKIVKSYDNEGVVGGEAPLTKDLIEISDTDFKKVSIASILAIFIIIMGVFMSFSLPILLVLSIELAILINLGISYYLGTTMPFVASIVIGTIQLGATVDYAILLTSRFREEMRNGLDKYSAMTIAVQSSAKSIVTSALSFFAATAGVGIISKLEMISSLCTLMARGAIISMLIILFILPSILLVCEKVIEKTSKNFKGESGVKEDEKMYV